MKQETIENIESTKKFLYGVGTIAGAISGVAMGILALIRVFFPDKPQNNNTK